MRKSGSQSQEREVQPLHGRSALLACFFSFFHSTHFFSRFLLSIVRVASKRETWLEKQVLASAVVTAH